MRLHITSAESVVEPWMLTQQESLGSYLKWKETLLLFLHSEPIFRPYLVHTCTWKRSSKVLGDPNRGFMDGDNSVPGIQSAAQKHAILNLLLGRIAVYCPILSHFTIVRQSTCINDIWRAVEQYFQYTQADLNETQTYTNSQEDADESLQDDVTPKQAVHCMVYTQSDDMYHEPIARKCACVNIVANTNIDLSDQAAFKNAIDQKIEYDMAVIWAAINNDIAIDCDVPFANNVCSARQRSVSTESESGDSTCVLTDQTRYHSIIGAVDPPYEENNQQTNLCGVDDGSIKDMYVLSDKTPNGGESFPNQMLTDEVPDCEVSWEGACYHELSHNICHVRSSSDHIKCAIGITDSNCVSTEAIVTTSKACTSTSNEDLHTAKVDAVVGGLLAQSQTFSSTNIGSQASDCFPTSAGSYRSTNQSFSTETNSNKISHCAVEWSKLDLLPENSDIMDSNKIEYGSSPEDHSLTRVTEPRSVFTESGSIDAHLKLCHSNILNDGLVAEFEVPAAQAGLTALQTPVAKEAGPECSKPVANHTLVCMVAFNTPTADEACSPTDNIQGECPMVRGDVDMTPATVTMSSSQNCLYVAMPHCRGRQRNKEVLHPGLNVHADQYCYTFAVGISQDEAALSLSESQAIVSANHQVDMSHPRPEEAMWFIILMRLNLRTMGLLMIPANPQSCVWKAICLSTQSTVPATDRPPPSGYVVYDMLLGHTPA